MNPAYSLAPQFSAPASSPTAKTRRKTMLSPKTQCDQRAHKAAAPTNQKTTTVGCSLRKRLPTKNQIRRAEPTKMALKSSLASTKSCLICTRDQRVAQIVWPTRFYQCSNSTRTRTSNLRVAVAKVWASLRRRLTSRKLTANGKFRLTQQKRWSLESSPKTHHSIRLQASSKNLLKTRQQKSNRRCSMWKIMGNRLLR